MVCFNDKAFRQKAEADPMTILNSPTSLRTSVSSIVWTHSLCRRCTPGCGAFEVPPCVALLNAANARSVASPTAGAWSTLSTPILSLLSKRASSSRKISTGKAANGISVWYNQRASPSSLMSGSVASSCFQITTTYQCPSWYS
jgi:hypothetical protein